MIREKGNPPVREEIGKLKLPWRKADQPNHSVDVVDSDQSVVNKELSLSAWGQVAIREVMQETGLPEEALLIPTTAVWMPSPEVYEIPKLIKNVSTCIVLCRIYVYKGCIQMYIYIYI